MFRHWRSWTYAIGTNKNNYNHWGWRKCSEFKKEESQWNDTWRGENPVAWTQRAHNRQISISTRQRKYVTATFSPRKYVTATFPWMGGKGVRRKRAHQKYIKSCYTLEEKKRTRKILESCYAPILERRRRRCAQMAQELKEWRNGQTGKSRKWWERIFPGRGGKFSENKDSWILTKSRCCLLSDGAGSFTWLRFEGCGNLRMEMLPT